MKFDLVILTDHRYVNPSERNDYIDNVLLEDGLVKEALEAKGLRVYRTNWDNPDFDWTTTKAILFRTTWDYFDRFEEFSIWLNKVSQQTKLINPESLIRWNIDKHYLKDLSEKGIHTVETQFIEQGEQTSLQELADRYNYNHFVLKPTVSGAARHTYNIKFENIAVYEGIYAELINNEAMMIQPFIKNITTKGEIAFMVFGGKFSHAILKKAKPGDFRVQDDFGGTVHDYIPTQSEITFAENVVSKCNPLPLYARVDAVWDNDGKLAVAELEMIEPELWFRNDPKSATYLADVIFDKYF